MSGDPCAKHLAFATYSNWVEKYGPCEYCHFVVKKADWEDDLETERLEVTLARGDDEYQVTRSRPSLITPTGYTRRVRP